MSAPAPRASRSPARQITVDEHHAGQRVDNFLHRELGGLPRPLIYRLLRRGEVRVNKGRVRQHYRLRPGDVVRIPPVRSAPAGARGDAPEAVRRRLADAVLYEQRGLLVVDKPAGVAAHGGSGVSHGVIETLRALRSREPFMELVHRLDRDTSGCMMLATRRSVLTGLHEALRTGRVGKRYLALVLGRWRGGPRDADLPLVKGRLRSGERVSRVDAQGRPAATRFVPIQVGDRASLLWALPRTGRTHQIRVHAAAVGHPLAGDSKYGERGSSGALADEGLQRLFLHAWSLDLSHPLDGAPVRVHAPLPSELATVLAALGFALPASSHRRRIAP